MARNFFDPAPEQQNVVFVAPATLGEAERLIQSCEHCHPGDADIPFDNILDRVTGSDPSVTDYILEEPAKCPQCGDSAFMYRRVACTVFWVRMVQEKQPPFV